MVDVGAHKGDGWTGYLKSALVKLVGLSERTVRRAVKVLRAIDVLEGAPPPPYQDDDGRYRRDPTTLRLRLPDWARAAHWRKPKPEKPQVQPSGQRWPLIAAPPPVDAYKPRDQDTETPVDSAPPWPRAPLPDDYLENRAALGSRRGATDARRRLKKRR